MEKGDNMPKSRMLTDNEVRVIAEDSLQFKAFAETLDEIISTSQTPLTIGIYGEWGSGKTSLMRLTEDILKEKKEKIKTVWFDAWKFNKTYDLRVALINTILKAMEKDQSVSDNVKIKAKDLLKRVNWLGLGRAAVSLGVPLIAPQVSMFTLLSKLLPNDKDNSLDILKLKEDILEEPVDEKTLDLIGDFENEFKDLTQEYVGNKDGKLVVFIDDLDRCIPETTIDILEAIKLFLNVPQSVFVIGADRKVIVNGIMQRYGEMSESWGRNYLEKIIQVPFRLPPLSKYTVTEYFIKGLDVSDAIKGYSDILAEVGDNPRTIKRLLNNFELQRIMADRRGLKLDESILAKLIVLEFRWPDFYNNLITLYSESEFNLIEELEKLSMADEADRVEKLNEWESIKEYYDDKNLRGFLDDEPYLLHVRLANYFYLAGTTKQTDDTKKDIKEYARRYFNLGYASYDKKDYDQSIEYFTKSIKLDPGYVNSYRNRGFDFNLKGEYDRAIEDYTKAIELDPNYTDTYLNRGAAYYNKGEYDRAIRDCNEAMELGITNPFSYYIRGLAYSKKEEHARAIEDHTKAIELDLDFKHFSNNYNDFKYLLTYLNKHKELIPRKLDHSTIEKAIKSSSLEKDRKDSVLSLLKSLEGG